MKFKFAGQDIEGSKIGYVVSQTEFIQFLKQNSAELEEIITDKLEEQDVFQWDELDLDIKVSTSGDENHKHVVLIGDAFKREESFDDQMLIRTIKGTIFCVSEEAIVT